MSHKTGSICNPPTVDTVQEVISKTYLKLIAFRLLIEHGETVGTMLNSTFIQ